MLLRERINHLGKQQQPFFLITDFLMRSPVLIPLQDSWPEDIVIQFPEWLSPVQLKNQQPTISKLQWTPKPCSFKAYETYFQQVQQQLQYGNSYLLNLTMETPVDTNWNLHTIFQSASAPYKIYYKNEWICFSPECFIKIHDQQISTYPMKGTLDASMPFAAEHLMKDPKELAEHYTIVDLLRNDLSQVSESVTVNRFRYLETIHTRQRDLLQASSEITGQLHPHWKHQLGDILLNLLPAGSISGAPKKKTIDLIQQIEPAPRGYYTGVAFYFDGNTVDSTVLIRFIARKPDGALVYKSGGGITLHSNARKEYEEMIQKIYVPGI